MEQKFDLAVVGAGPGGYAAAIEASRFGMKTILFEEENLGGTCLNRGCIPTKTLLHSAEVYQMMLSSHILGIDASSISYNYGMMADRKDAVVSKLREGLKNLIAVSGCKTVRGKAVLAGRNNLIYSGIENGVVFADKIILATGSHPAKLPIKGIQESFVMDSDRVLEMTTCPDRLIIIGGGVIGIEYASLWNSLGKEVTVIEMADTILPGMDLEIVMRMRELLERKGIRIYTGARVDRIEAKGQAVCRFHYNGSETKVSADSVVIAAGRKPNIQGIGLENVGIVLDNGFIKVDEKMETSVNGIYAIGDVTGKKMLAHLATAQGLVAASNASGGSLKIRTAAVPSCIYSSPEVAYVGMTENEAVAKGYNVKTGKFPFGMNSKSVLMDKLDGLAKIVSDAQTGEILGVHLIGHGTTELIAQMCIAIKLEATICEMTHIIYPHPTVSEVIIEAVNDVVGRSLHKPH